MILYRYFAREVFSTMFAVASIVLVISMGWRFSGYLNEAASGGITKDVLFLIMAYRLPGFLELILPISFFLSIMLAYGRLHVDSEMVVLEACGMSPFKLILITLLLAFGVMLLTSFISLWLKPSGEAKVETLFVDQRSLTEFDTLAPGRFQNLRSGKRVTYAEHLDDDGTLRNVFINEQGDSSDAPGNIITVHAKSGNTMVDAQGNRFLVLKNGTRYSGKPGDADYRVIEYEEYGQFIQKEKAGAGISRRSAIPTKQLFTDDSLQNQSELQWRFSVILMIPIVALLAIPMSRVNPRQGRFNRLLPGMMLCFLYVVFLSSARSAVEDGRIPVGIGLWWIHAVYLGIVIVAFQFPRVINFFRQVIGRRRPRVATA